MTTAREERLNLLQLTLQIRLDSGSTREQLGGIVIRWLCQRIQGARQRGGIRRHMKSERHDLILDVERAPSLGGMHAGIVDGENRGIVPTGAIDETGRIVKL